MENSKLHRALEASPPYLGANSRHFSLTRDRFIAYWDFESFTRNFEFLADEGPPKGTSLIGFVIRFVFPLSLC